MTDYVTPYEDPAEVIDPHYSGCMSNLIVNGQHYPLNLERGWTGWSIGDCDGTACGAEVWIKIFHRNMSSFTVLLSIEKYLQTQNNSWINWLGLPTRRNLQCRRKFFGWV